MKEFAHPGLEEMTSVDINRAIRNTISVARNEWKHVAEVSSEFDPDLPWVTCVPGALNQVLLNIFVNAAHAIGEVSGRTKKGAITVVTRRDGDWAEIRIGDTGAGIPEEIRQRIFDPFFTTKQPGKGTGQGLASAHYIVVKKHHGTIAVESEVGIGTTFIIRLPMYQDMKNSVAE
jgi:signal transduction histidine kinase